MIHYIILSCEKLKYMRKIQRMTWLSSIGIDDTYCFLSAKPKDPSKTEYNDTDVYWTNTTDDYLSCPHKYIDYFRNGLKEINQQWYFFCDDDSFIITHRLKKLLSDNHRDSALMIMNPNSYEKPDPPESTRHPEFKEYGETFYPNISPLGGGGFILNSIAMRKVRDYIVNTANPAICVNSDRAFAHWFIGSGCNLSNIIFHNGLCNNSPKDGQLKDERFLSFHRISSTEMIKLNTTILNDQKR